MADTIDIELDDTTPERRAAAAASFNEERAPIELVTPDDGCIECGKKVPLNLEGVCERCHRGGDIAAIAEQSRAVGERTTLAPSSRGADNAPAHHDDTHTNDDAIAAMRQRAVEQRERDAAQRAAAAEAEIQRRVSEEIERQQRIAERAPNMRNGDLIAGAAAEGHGVLVGWRGKGDMTRATIASVLDRANLPTDWTPEAVSAEAQASRAIATLRADGYTVRNEKKRSRQVVEAKECDARWIIDSPNHGASVGDKSGDVILVASLYGDKLELEGDEALAERVRGEYKSRIDAELCKSADITAWMQNALVEKMDAVRYGVGWYVPRAHAATANTLCQAFELAGWGAEDSWISPALPIASGDQLRAGLLRGLAAEVKAVLEQVTKEREIARTKENREDIGPKRAATFLSDLKTVGRRVVAYGALLGADMVATLRTAIADAIGVLETSLSEEDRAITTRFQNIWEEIERDRAAAGGVL